MDRYLNKRYKLVESQNYDAYLRRNKVKFFFRKLEQMVYQVIKLSEKEGKYNFETFWPMTSSSAVFRTGVPFDETRIDGVVCKSVIEFRDNKMIHTQLAAGIRSVFVREYADDEVNVTVRCGDTTSTRTYVRIFDY